MTERKKSGAYERVILASFGFSAFASLAFEVIWSRELTYVFGSNIYAISTVLTSFMAGLALGSFVFGRLADRTPNPLRVFALLQTGLGGYGLLTLAIFEILHKPYFLLHQLFGNTFLFYYAEFILAFGVLIIPSSLMGGSFPVVGRLLAKRPMEVGKKVGDVYSYDSLGAALGSFAAGVLLVPLIGHTGVILLASFVCLAIGAVSYYMSRGFSSSIAEKKDDIIHTLRALSQFDRVILFSFYLSGYAALTYEIVWTRLLSLVFGTGTYAFSIMLAAYFSGLMLGSRFMGRCVDRIKSHLVYLALLEFGIGLFGLLFLPVFPKLDMPYLVVRKLITNPYLIMAAWVAIPFFLLIPTAMMGATLPLVSKILARGKGRIGADLGMVYSANTVGGISGAWWTGFIIIPYLGVEKATVLAAISNLGAALLIFNASGLGGKRSIDVARYSPNLRKGFYAGVAVTLGMSIFFSAYTMDSTYAGIYYLAKTIPIDVWKSLKESQVEVFEKETLYGYVHVWDLWGSRYFAINGKVEASTMINDLSTQYLLAYLPMLVHERPKKVLNIGMGTGITFSRVGVFDVEEMTTVEINPVVVDVAGKYFTVDNLGVKKDPRARVVIEDARNFLATDKGSYDVVISDPQDVWNSGSSALFTYEYYSLIRKHLKEGGVFAQYITSADYGAEDFRILLNTISHAFPYLSVWESANTLLILASVNPVALDYDRIMEALNKPQFSQDVQLISGGKDTIGYLAGRQVMSEAEVKEFIRGASLNTDDKPVLEYYTNMNLLLAEGDPAYQAIIDFKRRNTGDAKVIPSFINHVERRDGNLGLEFMGLEVPLGNEWKNEFSGYVFDYREDSYSRFPPGYSKFGAKKARFEKGDAVLEFNVMPIEFLIGNARGELMGILNSEIEGLVRDFLSERGESLEFVRGVKMSGDDGYIISASSGKTSSEILIFYCDEREEVNFITLSFGVASDDYERLISTIKHTH